MSRVLPQLICFSYHKSGTSLFFHVMTKVSRRLGLVLANHYGLVDQLDPVPDVVLLPHSLLRAPLDRPYRAIRLIRDPRDIWVSGYLYHLRCNEEWCRNTDLDPTPPIEWPRVDYSLLHMPEEWKRRYLERLNGKSYQQNLNERSLADGLDWELEGYTGRTLAAMREWKSTGADALDVKLEDVMVDFDGAMLRIFEHFGFSEDQSNAALEVARSEDVRRMDDASIAKRPQIHSRTISKWRGVLSAAQIARFEESHGDLIRELGYAPADASPSWAGNREVPGSPAAYATERAGFEPIASRLDRPPKAHSDLPTAVTTTQDADIRLLADDRSIRPIATGTGSYTFVVPAGSQQVSLESRVGFGPHALASDRHGSRGLGVCVQRIVIRPGADVFVIAADDPRLTTGWHEAEQAGFKLWRWTKGSAVIPWAGVSGAALVTVHCMPLAEQLVHGFRESDDRREDLGDGRLLISQSPSGRDERAA